MSADARVKSLIDRVLRLKEEQDTLAEDIREVYAEAARCGYSKTALGMMVRDERQKSQGWRVYFAIFPQSGLLKIGISKNVERRLEALSYSRGEKAGCLGSFPSTFPMEGWYHAQFGSYRLHGEYFALNDVTRQMAREIIERENTQTEAA